MKIIIDEKIVEAGEGMSVLEAALEAGVYIPHLCKHPDLEAVGGCRLCSVEIEGHDHAVPSCQTTVREGMVVTVHSEKADKVRKMAMELILATHPSDCTGCPKYGKCELQSMYQYMGVGPERWRKKQRTVPNDSSNPLIQHLFTRCVRCGRCIRACRELRGVKVLDFQRTKDGVRAGTDDGALLEEAGCKFCGACIEVCPTGSIMDAIGLIKENISYSDSVVPCRGTCPARIDIPRYIRYIKMGEYEKATAVIREKVPFPETLGCVCTHVCEDQCKRNELGDPISICKLKRAAASRNKLSSKKNSAHALSPTGKKAAVIGGGPAGLTAAYYLARKGHAVTVFEQNEKAGGQCRYGIPAYRLPDEVIDREIADILEVGIKLVTNIEIKKPDDLLEKGYDAVLVAVGTQQGKKLPISGNDLEHVYLNTDFLKLARQGTDIDMGERVMILGGGNVAYDCARTALRQGAKEVHLACLESVDKMTASKEEIEEGREEGIILHASQSFLRIIGEVNAEGVELQEVSNCYFDENKRPVLETVEGSNKMIPIDTVIFAVGQNPKGTDGMELELTHGTYIKTNDQSQTSKEGIFAAGDAVTGTRSVIEAIAAGRRSAESIDRFFGGDGDISEKLLESEIPDVYLGRQPGFSKLERAVPELMDAGTRCQSFGIVEEVLTEEAAFCEASRCLQCDLRLNIIKPKLWNEYQGER